MAEVLNTIFCDLRYPEVRFKLFNFSVSFEPTRENKNVTDIIYYYKKVTKLSAVI